MEGTCRLKTIFLEKLVGNALIGGLSAPALCLARGAQGETVPADPEIGSGNRKTKKLDFRNVR